MTFVLWMLQGDFLCCNFPLSQSLTLLGLSIVEFGAGYAAAGATADALDALRWGVDFLVASRISDVETVAQIGDPSVDHSFWEPAEQATQGEGARPAYTVSPSVPGSDVQGAMAGALAVASIVWSDEDPAYSRHLLANARELYALATAFPGTYNSLQQAAAVYPSSGFQDDLAFAGALLFYRTNESHYLSEAQRHYSQAGELSTYGGFSWDSKNAGAALYLGLLLPSPANQPYLAAVSSYLNSWSTGRNGVTLTPKGFSWLSEWGSLRYSESPRTPGSSNSGPGCNRSATTCSGATTGTATWSGLGTATPGACTTEAAPATARGAPAGSLYSAKTSRTRTSSPGRWWAGQTRQTTTKIHGTITARTSRR